MNIYLNNFQIYCDTVFTSLPMDIYMYVLIFTNM